MTASTDSVGFCGDEFVTSNAGHAQGVPQIPRWVHRSAATIRIDRTNLAQFIAWLEATNSTVQQPADISRTDIAEYLPISANGV